MHKCYKKYDWKNKNYHMPSWSELARFDCDHMVIAAACGQSYKDCIRAFSIKDYKIIGERAAKRFGRLRRRGKVKFGSSL